MRNASHRVRVKHAIITPACRQNRMDDGAFEEAARRLQEEYEAILAGWRGEPREPTFHLVLMLEKPPRE